MSKISSVPNEIQAAAISAAAILIGQQPIPNPFDPKAKTAGQHFPKMLAVTAIDIHREYSAQRDVAFGKTK